MKKLFAAAAAVLTLSVILSSVAEARCGSRGGPGHRLPSGKCASHGR